MSEATLTLEVGGQAAPAELLEAVHSVEVEDHAEQADMLRMRLATAVARAGGRWDLLDSGLLGRLTNVKVGVRIGDGPSQPLIDAFLIDLRAELSSEPGRSSVEVVAMDASALLQLEQRVRSWPEQSDAQIAEAIFAAAGLATEVEPTQPARDRRHETTVQRGDDLGFLRRLAERNGMLVPDGVFDTPERFAYTDFLDFLRTYDLAASVIRTGDDYRDVTYEYLAGCAREGALYVELTASPDHAALVGLSDEEHLDGIARGIDDARAEFGVEGRILISCVRNFGVEQALRVARYAAELPHPYVVGFSMAGDEQNFPAGDYAEPFEIAASAGLGCTVHAGEWAGAGSVRAALELPVTRIGHGVRAIEDAALVEQLAERGIVLECCPTSNVVLGAFPTYEEHPLPRLRAAGVKVTLGSDDPPYFGASIGGEYAVCRERFGYDDEQLRDITRTALEAAFCEETLKNRLIRRAQRRV